MKISASKHCSGILFALSSIGGEAGEGVGIREDFLSESKFSICFLWARDILVTPEKMFSETW